MTFRKLVLAALAAPLCAAAQSAHSAPAPMDRDHSVIDAFQVFCDRGPPDFAVIDATVTAARMLVVHQESGRAKNGAATRSKSWGGVLHSGPFVLMLDEMDGAKGTATACAVAATVPDVARFRAVAIEQLRLTEAKRQPDRPENDTNEWYRTWGPGTTLIIRSIVKGNESSVMVKVVYMHHRQ
jgi:hypothetical protein